MLHSGIVDQDIDRTPFGFDGRNRPVDGVRIGHVESRGFDCPADAFQGIGRLLQALFGTPVQHHGRAALGHAARERKADALTGTGYKCATACNIEQ